MLMFTLTIYCLTTQFTFDSWNKHSRSICNIVLYSIGLFFTTRHSQNWASFLLWLSLFILSGAISHSSLIADWTLLSTKWMNLKTSQKNTLKLKHRGEKWREKEKQAWERYVGHIHMPNIPITQVSRIRREKMEQKQYGFPPLSESRANLS